MKKDIESKLAPVQQREAEFTEELARQTEKVCVCVCVCVNVNVCMYEGMYRCMYVCVYVCMCVCVYVCKQDHLRKEYIEELKRALIHS